jgi:hypothetical protein
MVVRDGLRDEYADAASNSTCDRPTEQRQTPVDACNTTSQNPECVSPFEGRCFRGEKLRNSFLSLSSPMKLGLD